MRLRTGRLYTFGLSTEGFAAGDSASTSRSMIKGRPPRLPHIFQSYSATLFFVTVCTLHRRRFPSLKTAQQALVVYGTRAMSEFNVALGRYVIMPDHLHFFIRGDQSFVLGDWVKGERCRGHFERNNHALFGSPDFLIIYCVTMKVTHKNGSTFARIRCAPDWLRSRKIGHTKARSFVSIAREV